MSFLLQINRPTPSLSIEPYWCPFLQVWQHHWWYALDGCQHEWIFMEISTITRPLLCHFHEDSLPHHLLLTTFSRAKQGKTKAKQRKFRVLFSYMCPTEDRIRDVLVPSKERWKDVERVSNGCWTGEAVDKDWICGEWRTHGKREGHIAVSTTSDCTQYLFGHARLGRFCKAQQLQGGTHIRKFPKKTAIFFGISLT